MPNSEQKIDFILNGKKTSIKSAPSERLSKVLRENLGLKGTKIGCNAGDCGSCTILIDNEAVCSCLIAIAKVNGTNIETIEGLNNEGTSNLQKSFLKHGAAQCGICTPGLLMSASSLIRKNPTPNKQEIEEALSGVLCRCTGYQKIITAILNVNSCDEEETSPLPGKSVGKRIPRIDGLKKVLGTEVFGADYWPENSLLLKIIRSPFHRAKFNFGDLENWKKNNKGIEIILTAKDIPGENKFGVIPNFADQPALAENEARFKGEAVAIIAGEYNAINNIIFNTFPINWKQAPESLTIESSMKKNAVQVHSNRNKNILIVGKVISGNPENAIEESEYSVSGKLETSYVEHAYIEPEAGSAWLENNTLVIQACTQAPIMDRDDTAKILGLNQNDVRIIPSTAGGGFGSKLDVSIQPNNG